MRRFSDQTEGHFSSKDCASVESAGLVPYQISRRAAVEMRTMIRNAALRIRPSMAGRMALHGCKEYGRIIRREKMILKRRSKCSMRKKRALFCGWCDASVSRVQAHHHAHHAVVLAIAPAACRKVGVRISIRGQQWSAQERAENHQQSRGNKPSHLFEPDQRTILSSSI